MPVEVGNLEEEWMYELIVQPYLGLNLDKRSDELQSGETLVLKNMKMEMDEVLVDSGYTAFGAAVLGTPRKEWAFKKIDGTLEDLLLTNITLYTYDTASSEWQFVTGPQATTIASTAAVATDLTVEVADDAGFADGEMIGIILDDGTMHMTTVNGTPAANVITIDDAFPSGAAIGNAVKEPPTFTGDDSTPVDMLTVSFANTVILTNGVDTVQKYDGTNCEDLDNLPSSGDTVCAALGQMATYLLLIATTEGGTKYRQRVRRCDTADITNWSTGNAGYNDLLDQDDACTAFKMLGSFGVVYKERSICRLELVATEDRLFQIDEDMIIGEGVLTPDQVAVVGGLHYFRGIENLYSYKGGYDLEPLGDKIASKLFLRTGEADPSYLNRAFLIHVKELNELWLTYTKSGDTSPKDMLRYRIKDKQFASRLFAHDVIGFGSRVTDSSVAWSELVGDWASQNFIWASPSLNAQSPTIHLCNPSGLLVYAYDFIAGSDAGTDLVFSYETQDFYNPHSSLRLDMVDLYCAGTAVTVEVSVDEGDTWETIDASLTLTAAKAHYQLSKQIVGRRLRFRFSGTGGGFTLSWYGFLFSLESKQYG